MNLRLLLRASSGSPRTLKLRYFTTTASSLSDEKQKQSRPSFLSFLDRSNTVASADYNRFLTVPGGLMVQTSIGSVYAWSTFNAPLTKCLGVVASSNLDWTLSQVVPIFSCCAVGLGITTTTLGPWAESAGPRKVAMAAALAWSGGLLVSAAGCHLHSLPLVYFGYGCLGGVGWGLGYISPVSNLMKWFPDRRGLATGMALAAFGGGAILAAPMNKYFCERNAILPDYLGSTENVHLITESGKRFAEVAGELKEVVIASSSDLVNFAGAQEGVYVVGSGDSGVVGCFLSLAVLHLGTMSIGAMIQKVPKKGWTPEGWTPPTTSEAASSINFRTEGTVDHVRALQTPQFWLMWAAVFGNAIAGVSIISCAKTMMGDVFGAAFPAIVTGTFATGYVASLSAANGSGRFVWATISDYIGRKGTWFLFGLGIPVALAVPTMTQMVTTGEGGTLPLTLFYGSTFLVVSFYGGLFSVLPAYIADTFGIKHAGAIHGRLLTAWAASALVGPSIMTTLRGNSYVEAATQLAAQCDPETFREKFGAGMDQLDSLIDAKTVTIAKLMDIVPVGTADPTPGIYDSTMFAMASIMGCAVLCNYLITPVDPKYFMEEVEELEEEENSGRGGG